MSRSTAIILFLLIWSSPAFLSQSQTKISGLWQLFMMPVDTVINALDGPEPFERYELYISGDSLWRLDFPCRIKSSGEFYPEDWSLHPESKVLMNRTGAAFMSVAYDSNEIKQLLQAKINTECYEGLWQVQRIESGGDGTGVEFIFPFEIPDSIHLSSQLIKQIQESGRLTLPVDDKQKTFDCYFCGDHWGREICLYPTDDWPDREKQMWLKDWNSPKLSKKELSELKKSTGHELTITLKKL